jgi:hypothetical protein
LSVVIGNYKKLDLMPLTTAFYRILTFDTFITTNSPLKPMGVNLFSAIALAFDVLLDPKKSFKDLEKKTLERVVADYIKILIIMAVLAAILNLIYWIGRSFYYDAFFSLTVEYPTMLNYALSTSSSLLFLYLYLGTFMVFILAVIIALFMQKFKFIEVIKITLYAMIPLLLFGWVPPTPLPFVIWSIVLFITGITTYEPMHIQKKSIQNRD